MQGRDAVVIGPIHPDSFAEHIGATLTEMGFAVTHADPRGLFTRSQYFATPLTALRSALDLAASRLPIVRAQTHRAMEKQIQECNPSLVLSTYGYITSDEMRSLRRFTGTAPWVLWYPDALVNVRPELFVAGWDFIFLKDPFLVDILSSRTNLPVHFLPEACNPTWHRTWEFESDGEREAYTCDVTTAGNIYPYRELVLETLAPHVRLKLYGNLTRYSKSSAITSSYTGRYVTGREKGLAFRGAKIVLNTLHYAEVRSCNARLFEATGCGAFVVTHVNDGVRDLFDVGREVIGVDSKDELREAVRHYLGDDIARAAVSAAGQRRAHREHTYRHRLEVLLAIIGV